MSLECFETLFVLSEQRKFLARIIVVDDEISLKASKRSKLAEINPKAIAKIEPLDVKMNGFSSQGVKKSVHFENVKI